ncbi:MAG: lipoyl domain-containing protein [Rhodobacteraceae bacterium]|nr:lipoyl domain-containing protein [Paracoccaceae bacterium]
MKWKVKMPLLGPTTEEGKILEWLMEVGDHVEAGDVLAIIESDKASLEVESPGTGVLLDRYADTGEMVRVGQFIALVGRPS